MLAIMPMLGWTSHLAHVMQLQAQNVHNITQTVYGHQQDVFGHTRNILDGQMGSHGKKKKNNKCGLGNSQALPGLFLSYGGDEITSNDHVA
jgi:hypothetical protein